MKHLIIPFLFLSFSTQAKFYGSCIAKSSGRHHKVKGRTDHNMEQARVELSCLENTLDPTTTSWKTFPLGGELGWSRTNNYGQMSGRLMCIAHTPKDYSDIRIGCATINDLHSGGKYKDRPFRSYGKDEREKSDGPVSLAFGPNDTWCYTYPRKKKGYLMCYLGNNTTTNPGIIDSANNKWMSTEAILDYHMHKWPINDRRVMGNLSLATDGNRWCVTYPTSTYSRSKTRRGRPIYSHGDALSFSMKCTDEGTTDPRNRTWNLVNTFHAKARRGVSLATDGRSWCVAGTDEDQDIFLNCSSTRDPTGPWSGKKLMDGAGKSSRRMSLSTDGSRWCMVGATKNSDDLHSSCMNQVRVIGGDYFNPINHIKDWTTQDLSLDSYYAASMALYRTNGLGPGDISYGGEQCMPGLDRKVINNQNVCQYSVNIPAIDISLEKGDLCANKGFAKYNATKQQQDTQKFNAMIYMMGSLQNDSFTSSKGFLQATMTAESMWREKQLAWRVKELDTESVRLMSVKFNFAMSDAKKTSDDINAIFQEHLNTGIEMSLEGFTPETINFIKTQTKADGSRTYRSTVNPGDKTIKWRFEFADMLKPEFKVLKKGPHLHQIPSILQSIILFDYYVTAGYLYTSYDQALTTGFQMLLNNSWRCREMHPVFCEGIRGKVGSKTTLNLLRVKGVHDVPQLNPGGGYSNLSYTSNFPDSIMPKVQKHLAASYRPEYNVENDSSGLGGNQLPYSYYEQFMNLQDANGDYLDTQSFQDSLEEALKLRANLVGASASTNNVLLERLKCKEDLYKKSQDAYDGGLFNTAIFTPDVVASGGGAGDGIESVDQTDSGKGAQTQVGDISWGAAHDMTSFGNHIGKLDAQFATQKGSSASMYASTNTRSAAAIKGLKATNERVKAIHKKFPKLAATRKKRAAFRAKAAKVSSKGSSAKGATLFNMGEMKVAKDAVSVGKKVVKEEEKAKTQVAKAFIPNIPTYGSGSKGFGSRSPSEEVRKNPGITKHMVKMAKRNKLKMKPQEGDSLFIIVTKTYLRIGLERLFDAIK